jgi:hypothetical protein
MSDPCHPTSSSSSLLSRARDRSRLRKELLKTTLGVKDLTKALNTKSTHGRDAAAETDENKAGAGRDGDGDRARKRREEEEDAGAMTPPAAVKSKRTESPANGSGRSTASASGSGAAKESSIFLTTVHFTIGYISALP